VKLDEQILFALLMGVMTACTLAFSYEHTGGLLALHICCGILDSPADMAIHKGKAKINS
jgi:hypothetical protein